MNQIYVEHGFTASDYPNGKAHPQVLYLDTPPKYSVALHFYIFISIHLLNHITLSSSIFTYLLDLNILANPGHVHFYVSTRPKYSCTSLPPQILLINSTKIFVHILDKSTNILLHPWHLHFYVSTRPKYSCASSTPTFQLTSLAKIFLLILDTSISTYLLDQLILVHPWHIHISTYLLDQNILVHPRHLNFNESYGLKYSFPSLTPPFLHIYSTKIFLHILKTSISTYQFDQNILAHPVHLNFYVFTWSKYSCASLTPPLLCICSTKIFLRILDTSTKYSIPSPTPPFLRIYSTKNILAHPLTPPFLRIYPSKIFLLSWTPPSLHIH